jgi:hypothetical protein
MTDPRILIFTPLLRSYGRAIVAAHRMIRAAPCVVEWLSVAHDQPHGYSRETLLYLYGLATKRTLDSERRELGAYTHLLCLEDDIVPPADAIAKLLACNAPVAYSLYCWRRSGHPWSIYRHLFPDSGASWQQDEPYTAAQDYAQERILDVAGVGLGCTLIRADVLRAVPWRLLGASGGAHNDWSFAVDCQRAGVRQVAHFGVRCGHILMEPSARVIWPDVVNSHATYRYEYFETEG